MPSVFASTDSFLELQLVIIVYILTGLFGQLSQLDLFLLH